MQAKSRKGFSQSGDLVDADLDSIVALVTVTYNPDIDVLRRQFDQLPASALKVLVDNASSSELRTQVRAMASEGKNIRLLENETNVGLAKALNQGAHHALVLRPACEYLVLLDQDTEPGVGGVESLLAAFRKLSKSQPRLGCVGPRLIDETTGLEHGFHQISGWRWVRRYPADSSPLRVENLNGSGILMPMRLYSELGGLDESFFIDHVDTEWSFRVLAHGRELFGVPGVQFKHRMGLKGIRVWFCGWHVWPYRSPGRQYYLFRNTVRLLLTADVPFVWKLWAPPKLVMTLVGHLALDSARWAQVAQMLSGLRDGFSRDADRGS